MASWRAATMWAQSAALWTSSARRTSRQAACRSSPCLRHELLNNCQALCPCRAAKRVSSSQNLASPTCAAAPCRSASDAWARSGQLLSFRQQVSVIQATSFCHLGNNVPPTYSSEKGDYERGFASTGQDSHVGPRP